MTLCKYSNLNIRINPVNVCTIYTRILYNDTSFQRQNPQNSSKWVKLYILNKKVRKHA